MVRAAAVAMVVRVWRATVVVAMVSARRQKGGQEAQASRSELVPAFHQENPDHH